ncbi:MAG: MFS transporter [Proteobacteria bacterium]|nr:MFS transporter [Pseudomonadota bacterium]MDE3207577.1 MFS transporter [Pseudomonadota bacterium]
MASRACRSLGQGALFVDFSLYLKAMHWTAPVIGSVLMSGLLFGALLSAWIGPLSDRMGRKPFLLAYEAVQVIAAGVAYLTAHPVWLIMAAIAGGYGRAGNGSAGPFAPLEHSWISQVIKRNERGWVYSINTAISFWGMALGAGLAVLPGLESVRYPVAAQAFRPIFLIVLAGSLMSTGLIYLARDSQPPSETFRSSPEQRHLDKEENRLLVKLAAINSLNGMGIGLVGPLIPYWFAIRFGEGPVAIGPVMAMSFCLAGLSSVVSGHLSRRIGVIRAVVGLRLVGLVLLVFIPFMPVFWLASLCYVVRAACNLGTAGARQALSISLVREHRRGLAATLNNISIQIPRAIGPLAAGLFYSSGMLVAPFFIALLFQGGYLALYFRVFQSADPSLFGYP